MSVGQGSLSVQQRVVPAPVPPAPTVTAANNGTSLSGTTVQFGQAVAAPGDPAQLLNYRDVPLNSFGIDFRGDNIDLLIDDLNSILRLSDVLGKRYLEVDPATDIYQLGDIDSVGNGMFLSLDDANNLGQIFLQGNPYLYLDKVFDFYSLGDLNSGVYAYADNTGSAGFALSAIDEFSIIAGAGGSSRIIIDGGQYMFVDLPLLTYSFGDLSAKANNTYVRIHDSPGVKAVEISNVREFADNAAAIVGGLGIGMMYRTGDFQKIVH